MFTSKVAMLDGWRREVRWSAELLRAGASGVSGA
jgi:hypothetical protein